MAQSIKGLGAGEAAERLDIQLGKRLAKARSEPLVSTVAKVGKLGDQEPLYVLSAGIVACGLVASQSRLARLGVQMGLAVAVADVMKSTTKKLVTRSRPNVSMDEGRYERDLGGTKEKPKQSFPSGHVACSLAAALAARRLYPGTWPMTAGLCVLLSWTRMAKGAHWPSDVAAGAVIGFMAEALAHLATRVLDPIGAAASRHGARWLWVRG